MNERRVALVTGGSRGIGRAVALRLAVDGFDVTVGYAGRKDAASEVVREIEKMGRKALEVQGDISVKRDVENIFEATLNRFGRLDAVVNCAGVMSMSGVAGGFTDANIEAFDRMTAVNLRGAFLVLAKAAEILNEGGRIVQFSTSAIVPAFPKYGPYTASKAGAELLVRVLANELRGRKITVNAIAPGPVATELFFEGKSEEFIQKMTKLPPLERLGEPEDISSVVSFMLSDDSGWLNGQVVRVNGGYV
ncbi:short-chain dehydrogenase/reductase SDR [Denitrovibrio acetiphilus DSM 12809]|jgi:3-oxoacyl-[acyl-carrier protein] reductase|uniref:Short-chain dehydrogenase/reductase SDR n=1 Tax=Denitrovibrio acetiphilus (strain DSM 12809 / NBRC 114555 / N2460) TaxID=522772 RepID=D4H199_DENA2|nr:SDR family oxidoreductase [Denitrovibrio acetiphilus]ADD66847.1 short-chain dehydrogenase/reductase SDR [Denitrovibrio acetiphilus DSM 12809]